MERKELSPVQRILCPIDFSLTSAHALTFAERLAESLAAEIVLLHVFDTPVALTPSGQEIPADKELQRQLESVRLHSSQVPVERVLHVGAPGPVICWLAEQRTCDLIVMGTHGREGLLHLLLGSVAEYVMRHARCPVLTVRLLPEKQSPLPEPLVLPLPAPRLM